MTFYVPNTKTTLPELQQKAKPLLQIQTQAPHLTRRHLLRIQHQGHQLAPQNLISLIILQNQLNLGHITRVAVVMTVWWEQTHR